MRWFDVRTILGAGLVLLGSLLFLEKLGFLRGAGGLFWGLVFLAGAAYFFYIFYKDRRANLWAIFPAMVLFGIGAEPFLPVALERLDGALFLGSISLAFWVVYLGDRNHWWAIIPGGVLATLAVITVLDDISGMATGSLFFLGLALTFLLVAVLPNPLGKTQWAYIPAGTLALIGVLLGSAATVGLAGYVWPVALIVVGVLFIFGFFRRQE